MTGNTGRRVSFRQFARRRGRTGRTAVEAAGFRGHIGEMTAEPDKPPEQPPPQPAETPVPAPRPREIGGPKGPEPTRYGDWEVGGRCTDF
jgi:Protein of unknown function (DUF1674)